VPWRRCRFGSPEYRQQFCLRYHPHLRPARKDRGYSGNRDKKGRVKEISIRTSTLLTEEGAEVIIPNGDVLSNRIVNWTLSNSHVRLALSFNIEKPEKPENIKGDAIREIVKSNPNVLQQREPQILLNALNSKTSELRVYCWINDVTRTQNTSGELRTSIYRFLDEQGIVVL